MLRLSELTTDFLAKVTKPLTFHEILRQLPSDGTLDNRQLEQYLKLLVDDQVRTQKTKNLHMDMSRYN